MENDLDDIAEQQSYRVNPGNRGSKNCNRKFKAPGHNPKRKLSRIQSMLATKKRKKEVK